MKGDMSGRPLTLINTGSKMYKNAQGGGASESPLKKKCLYAYVTLLYE